MNYQTENPLRLQVLCLAVAAVGSTYVSPAVAQEATRSATLEEVVVTAQRRAETLQEVPLAVTALNEDTIERRQIIDTKQIVFNVPNLTGNSNVGQQTATTFFIRGVGTTESLATVDTTVAVYVDDVYVARQGVNNFNLFDVERIEVLRGPQGTLYGRNATGGAIKIVNKAPSAEDELKLEAAVGNYDRYRLKLSGNTAVSDSVYFRGSLLTEQGDGYSNNLTLGKDVNDLDYMGMRGALRWLVSDDAELTLAADWSRDKQNGLFGSDIGGIVRPRTNSLFDVVSGQNTENTAETYGLSLHYRRTLNSDWDFESITGYRNTTQKYDLDLSDQPRPIFVLTTDTDSSQFSQEFKLAGNMTEALHVTAGIYAFWEQSDVYVEDDFAPAGTGPRVPILVSGRTFDVETRSLAAYAQFDYDVTDRLTATVGLRYTVDQKEISANQIINGSQGYNDSVLQASGVDLQPDFDEFTPKFGISYAVSDQLNTYASFTRGFRSGGWQARVNAAAQFKNFPAEIVDSYELGAKASLFNDRVVWNVAMFYTEYSDLFNSVPGADNTFLVATADAEIYGLESELTWRATPWLDLFANFGTLNTKYVDLIPAVQAQLGSELQRAPDFQGKMGFSVDYPLANGSLLVNGDIFYTSEFYTNPQNDIAGKTGDFSLINLSVGYRFAGGRYSVSANCRNCANEEYFDSILSFPASGFVMVYPGAPRFYELAFKMSL